MTCDTAGASIAIDINDEVTWIKSNEVAGQISVFNKKLRQFYNNANVPALSKFRFFDVN